MQRQKPDYSNIRTWELPFRPFPKHYITSAVQNKPMALQLSGLYVPATATDRTRR